VRGGAGVSRSAAGAVAAGAGAKVAEVTERAYSCERVSVGADYEGRGSLQRGTEEAKTCWMRGAVR
jgi:hypothetical protein